MYRRIMLSAGAPKSQCGTIQQKYGLAYGLGIAHTGRSSPFWNTVLASTQWITYDSHMHTIGSLEELSKVRDTKVPLNLIHFLKCHFGGNYQHGYYYSLHTLFLHPSPSEQIKYPEVETSRAVLMKQNISIDNYNITDT